MFLQLANIIMLEQILNYSNDSLLIIDYYKMTLNLIWKDSLWTPESILENSLMTSE